jgi:hypothetical protein
MNRTEGDEVVVRSETDEFQFLGRYPKVMQRASACGGPCPQVTRRLRVLRGRAMKNEPRRVRPLIGSAGHRKGFHGARPVDQESDRLVPASNNSRG